MKYPFIITISPKQYLKTHHTSWTHGLESSLVLEKWKTSQHIPHPGVSRSERMVFPESINVFVCFGVSSADPAPTIRVIRFR